MKVTINYSLTIFGITYQPREIKYSKYNNTLIDVINVVYHLEGNWTVILTAIGDTTSWGIAVTNKLITYDDYKSHKHIAPPDFNLTFATPIEDLESDIENCITNFDNAGLLGDTLMNLIRTQYQ